MKRVARLLVSVLLAVSLGLFGAAPTACSGADSETSGKRLALTVRVAPSPGAQQPFLNAQGWTITLSRAVMATGALYFYDGATLFSHRARPAPPGARTPGKPLRDALRVRSAFAHPGHYVPGNARGELLAPSSVDLREGATLGEGRGVSGVVRSATFSFHSPAGGPFAAELADHVVVLEGTASKAGAARLFRAEVAAVDLAGAGGLSEIEGCPFAEVDMQSGGVVTLTVDLAQWFAQVELDEVPESGPVGGAFLLPGKGVAMNGLTRGMKAGRAYSFAYVPR